MSPTKADGVDGHERARHALLEARQRRRPHRAGVDVGAGQHLHVRQGLGGGLVHPGDLRVRERRADERDLESALERQVLDVAPLTTQETRVFLPQYAISEDAHGRRAYRYSPERTIGTRGGVQLLGQGPALPASVAAPSPLRRHRLAQHSVLTAGSDLVVPESKLEQTQHGLVPRGEGWYVLNMRDAEWRHVDGRGAVCVVGDDFEGERRFEQLGVNPFALQPGEPMSMYHCTVRRTRST